jgi:ribonuclease Y
MSDIVIAVSAGFAVALCGGLGIFIFLRRKLNRERLILLEEKTKIIEEAKKEAEALKKEARLEAKNITYQAKAEAEKELKEKRYELSHLEKRLRQKEEALDRKFEQIERKEQELSRRDRELHNREKELSEKEKRYEALIKEQMVILERISGMSEEEARKEFLKRVEEEMRLEAARLSKRIEDEAREMAEKRAKEIISFAVQRYANDYVADETVTAVSLPSDEMKGRIIGREGRNIRALEAATGVDVIVDDTPELVTLSCFDPVRREIARLSLERLIADGRIHPARIEEVVEKVRREVEAIIKEEGERAVFELGISGIHPDLIPIIGRLKYRTSYGQNVLQHSIEVAHLASMMAYELGVDPKLAKRAGLLHDIGKAVDHEMEGSHQQIGANLARRYGESQAVINAILVHHGDGDPETVEAALVAAADALSAARPGVRRESIESYLKRLKQLEEMAMSFKGVQACYAMQAGREIRIIVRPEEVSDEECAMIARDLSRKIEAQMSYPGQIKVTVIRETRYIDYAK